MKKLLAGFATGTVVALLVAQSAFAVSWTDWNTISTGTAGTGAGTISTGSGNVGVTLNGLLNAFVNGDYYYNNGTTGWTSATGTYDGLVLPQLEMDIQAVCIKGVWGPCYPPLG